MAYEILLDDFLAKLSKKGIDISKLTIEEESTTDRLNITKEEEGSPTFRFHNGKHWQPRTFLLKWHSKQHELRR